MNEYECIYCGSRGLKDCSCRKSKEEKSKKEYKICYKFSDVMDVIKAKNKEQAKKQAEEKLLSDENPQNDTYCYEIEVEEND